MEKLNNPTKELKRQPYKQNRTKVRQRKQRTQKRNFQAQKTNMQKVCNITERVIP